MTHFLFVLAKVFPYLAAGVIIVLAQVWSFYRRRGSKLQYPVFAFAAFLGLLIILWAVFRGDMNSDRWMREALNRDYTRFND
ncbi:hypothetical protein WDW37_13475 [Bdellovibrionota bacterium FG-1]